MGPYARGAPGNCPVCPYVKTALGYGHTVRFSTPMKLDFVPNKFISTYPLFYEKTLSFFTSKV